MREQLTQVLAQQEAAQRQAAKAIGSAIIQRGRDKALQRYRKKKRQKKAAGPGSGKAAGAPSGRGSGTAAGAASGRSSGKAAGAAAAGASGKQQSKLKLVLVRSGAP